MPLLNLSVVSTRKTHIPWTVVQIEPGLTFCQLLLKILGTTYPILPVDEVLSRSKLDKVFVGNSRECQSTVDDNLVIDDVCAAFGQHVKYLVMESEPSASAEQVSRNAFSVLIESQRAIDLKPTVHDLCHSVPA